MSLPFSLKGNLEEFKRLYSIEEDNETKAFEHFINYLIVTKYSPNSIEDSNDILRINVDSKSQFGIDGIAIIVNGNLVPSPSDIDDYINSHKLDVQIIFTQVKTEECINTGDLLKCIHAAKTFLHDPESLNEKNDNAACAIEIYKKLFENGNSRYFTSESPQAFIYYVTAASKTSSEAEKICRESEAQFSNPDIKSLKIHIMDSPIILSYYREVSNSVNVRIHMENRLELNQITGVKKAYIGYISGKEYLKMITDDSDDLRRRIFYENVRDYQGYHNPVNEEIRNTIRNMEDKFILLNNGVTIITRSLDQLGGNNFELRDFQVVNGCQTSSEIFNERHKITNSDSLDVPVKLIHTDDLEVIANIVRATNRQTPVAEEAFIALTEYHKELEEIFKLYSDKEEMPLKIYYERRAGELNDQRDLRKYQRVSLHQLIRTITSVYFQDAYVTVSNNPANTLRGRKNKLFQQEQPQEIYYISTYLFALVNKLCEEKKIDRIAGALKYHVIMTARCLILMDSDKPDLTNTKKLKHEAQQIMQTFKDESKMINFFNNARYIVYCVYNEYSKRLSSGSGRWRNIAGASEFNKQVLKKTRELIDKHKQIL